MYGRVPCYRAEITTGFFKKEEITLIDWLTCLPDLNPIENIRSQLKRAINNRKYIPKFREKLFLATQEEWARIEVETFNKLIASMPERMEACIAAHGGHTR